LTQEETRYERNPEFVFRKIVDELVLVPIRQNVADMDCIYTMNPLGAFIWERLDGSLTLGELSEAIMDEYDVASDVADADLLEFVRDLEQAGAVRRV